MLVGNHVGKMQSPNVKVVEIHSNHSVSEVSLKQGQFLLFFT
jgi:hypothetical protein